MPVTIPSLAAPHISALATIGECRTGHERAAIHLPNRMDHRPNKTLLRIGDWRVDPGSGQISRNGQSPRGEHVGDESLRLEARTMRLLLCLAERAGQTVSIDELLNHAWSGVAVSQDSVYQAVASLRRLLGDDPKQPTYIATVPRLGYRLIAKVEPWTEPPASESALPPPTEAAPVAPIRAPVHAPRSKARLLWTSAAGPVPAGLLLACLVLVGVVLTGVVRVRSRTAGSVTPPPPAIAARSPRSVAVLPFLDLTEGMKEEEFADGMTEELIDKLSKIPGLRVPSATSSFYFKNKQIPVAEIANSLGVVYVLDGSVRKSNGRVRIAARLMRAANGYVAWSETYDRAFNDLIMVQDDIAGEVTKALKTSIGTDSAPQ